MDPSGTLRVGTSVFSLGACFGDETTITVFETNPKSYVSSFVDRSVGCDVENANGDTGFLFTNLDPDGSFIDATAFPAGGGHPIGAFGDEAPSRPELVPVAAERFAVAHGTRIAPSCILVIGDTPRDVHCALENGCRALAVATGLHSIDVLRDAGAHVVVEDLRDPAPLWRLLA